MKKKILHVSGFGYGGIQNVVFSICEKCDKKLSFYVFGTKMDSDNSNIERFKNIETTVIESENKSKIGYFYEYFKAIKRVKPDCVHLHQFYASGVLALISKICGVKKIIVQAHNTSSIKESGFFRKAYTVISKFLINQIATNCVAVSEDSAKTLFYPKTLASEKYSLILNGIDLLKFSTKNVLEFTHEYFNDSNKIIASVGRLTKQKNYPFLINLMAEICQKRSDIKLIIAGDGEDKDYLQHLVKEKKLENAISFVGFIDNIPGLLSQSDLFVLPSLWEGFGIVYIEAQMMGLTCIASSCIPHEADLGKMEFISLDKDISFWVDRCILNVNNPNLHTIDINKIRKIDINTMIERYNYLYLEHN